MSFKLNQGQGLLDTDRMRYAHTSAVTALTPIFVHSLGALVPMLTADANVASTYWKKGRFICPIYTAITISVGDPVFYITASDKVTNVNPGSSGFYFGRAVENGTAAAGYVLVELNAAQTLVVGAPGTPVTLGSYANHALEVYSTSASTDASNTVEPVKFESTLTGAGAVGRTLRCTLNVSNITLGGWTNCARFLTDWKTSGQVTGLGSGICVEMTMQGGAVTYGTYAVLELELVCPTSWSGTVPVSFIAAYLSGATAANFDSYGYLFDISGVTVGSGKFFQANTAGASTHALRCRINGTAYYAMVTSVGA